MLYILRQYLSKPLLHKKQASRGLAEDNLYILSEAVPRAY
jgi:hypothetical protein